MAVKNIAVSVLHELRHHIIKKVYFGRTELNSDSFYSEENMMRLSVAITDAKSGRNMTEHELIEVD